MYDCLQVLEDDHCAAGRSYVQVLARKPQINVAEEALYNALLVQFAPALHLDVTEVERVPQIRKNSTLRIINYLEMEHVFFVFF